MASLAEVSLVRGLNFLADSQSTISNNLANISSSTYKRRLPVTESSGQSFSSFLNSSFPNTTFNQSIDWSVGSLNATGNQAHVALKDENQFFKVLSGNGQEYYTRTGDLQMNAAGELVTRSGYRLLDPDNSPINMDSLIGDGSSDLSRMKISSTGQITLNTNTAGAKLGVFAIEDKSGLKPIGDGLYMSTGNKEIPAVASNEVAQGSIEQSNVDSVSEMVAMIVNQRSFQSTMGALTTLGRIKDSYSSALNR